MKFIQQYWRKIVYVLIGIGLIATFFGNPAFRTLLKQYSTVKELEKQLNDIREENFRLRRQLYSLKHDPLMIEEVARRELKMIKPGEIIYLDEKTNVK